MFFKTFPFLLPQTTKPQILLIHENIRKFFLIVPICSGSICHRPNILGVVEAGEERT